MPLILQGATSGSTTIQATDAVTQTITLPNNSGTVLTSASPASSLPSSINGPAFSAYRATSNQSISNATFTKVQLNAEEYDTNNNFDSTTNYRFTPTVAGYYQINANISYVASSGLTQIYLAIYKNGSAYSTTNSPSSYGAGGNIGRSMQIYMNGSTDYIELYAYSDAGTGTALQFSSVLQTFMNGTLVRSA
jgi:hypothetical protein